MECLSCRKPLIILESGGVEVDYCTLCQGIWLDAGELELLIPNSQTRSNLSQKIVRFNSEETPRKCPICSNKMEKARFDNNNFLIDRCTAGHGLWFDKGELEKVLDDHNPATDEDKPVFTFIKEVFKK